LHGGDAGSRFERGIPGGDARVIFRGTGGTETTSSISHLNGIEQAEAILEWPYRIRDGDKVSDSSILELPYQSSMYHLLTPDGLPTDVAENGILLTQSLKKKSDAEIGDELQLEPIVGTVGQTLVNEELDSSEE